jgi:hypothetical protein
VRLSIELGDSGVRVRIGPLSEVTLAEALQGPEPQPGQLTLRRVLQTVVDSFGLEDADREGLYVRLDKVVHRVQ